MVGENKFPAPSSDDFEMLGANHIFELLELWLVGHKIAALRVEPKPFESRAGRFHRRRAIQKALARLATLLSCDLPAKAPTIQRYGWPRASRNHRCWGRETCSHQPSVRARRRGGRDAPFVSSFQKPACKALDIQVKKESPVQSTFAQYPCLSGCASKESHPQFGLP